MNKVKNIFNWLEEISYHKSDPNVFSEEDFIGFDSFMIHRFISMKEIYLPIVNIAQTIPPKNKKQIYQFYREIIPKKKTWFKYIKGKKSKNNKELTELLSKYFSNSFRETNEYIEILGKNEIENILKKMGKDDKEIKKMLK